MLKWQGSVHLFKSEMSPGSDTGDNWGNGALQDKGQSDKPCQEATAACDNASVPGSSNVQMFSQDEPRASSFSEC